MIRTQISLEEGQKRRLDREAERTGRSLSDLIREAVDASFPDAADPDVAAALIKSALGAWADRPVSEAAADGRAYVEQLRKGRRLG